MAEVEDRLRAAMHATVDAEESVPRELITLVMRRHRRRNALVAGVAVLAVLAAAVPAAIALHAAAGPAPATSHPAPKKYPTKMTGVPMPAAANLQFLIQRYVPNQPGLDQPAWYSTASGQTQRIAGVPFYGVYKIVRVVGGWSASLLLVRWTCPPHCWLPQDFIPDGSAKATHIGVGFAVSPSDRPGAVWLVSYPRGTVSLAKTPAIAQLVSTAGRPLGAAIRLPVRTVVVSGVGSDLLLESISSGRSAHELWDPRTKRVVRRIDRFIAAGPNQIAWSPDCRGCHVQLLNVSTGKVATTPIPAAWPPSFAGTFSDDGKLLAIRLPSRLLGVLDTSSGVLTVIPGTALSTADWQNFGWQNGGHRLVITSGPNRGPGPDQVAYWDPGDTRIRVKTVPNGAEKNAIVSMIPLYPNY